MNYVEDDDIAPAQRALKILACDSGWPLEHEEDGECCVRIAGGAYLSINRVFGDDGRVEFRLDLRPPVDRPMPDDAEALRDWIASVLRKAAILIDGKDGAK